MHSGHTHPPQKLHTRQKFNNELNQLYCLIVQMSGLVQYQLRQALLALVDEDEERAINVVARDRRIDEYEIIVDSEVLNILSKESPVAGDLQIVLLTSKIGFELQRIGNEIADFSRLVAKLYNPETSYPNPFLLADIFKIGKLVEDALNKLMEIVKNQHSNDAFILLEYVRECEAECRNSLEHQLALVIQEPRMMGRAIDIMKMIKVLETCGEHCRDIAKHVINRIENNGMDTPIQI